MPQKEPVTTGSAWNLPLPMPEKDPPSVRAELRARNAGRYSLTAPNNDRTEEGK